MRILALSALCLSAAACDTPSVPHAADAAATDAPSSDAPARDVGPSPDAALDRCGFDGDPAGLTDLATTAIWRSDYAFAEIFDMPGLVLTDFRSNAHVFVRSDAVVLRRFLLDPSATTGGYYTIRTDGRDPGAGLLVESGTITATSVSDDGPLKGVLVDVPGMTLRDLDISGSHDGISVAAGNLLVEHTCIHDLGTSPTAHNDGIEIYGGARVVIRDVVIDNPHDQTSAINITNDYGPIDDVVIEHAHLAGGGYTIYVRGDGASGGAVTNLHFRDVVIDRPGSFGVLSYEAAPGAIVEWDVRDAQGRAIPMP
ncbi:MAG: hypothetical protein U0234_29115 [Sandaracinus sp.]